MKAIVLTCDRYRVLAEHMMFQYQRLWPHHNFEWIVPYQEDRRITWGQTPVKTAPGIKATVLTLLDNIPDNDLIYWAIDDRYPIMLDVDRIRSLIFLPETNGLLFTRVRDMINSDRGFTGKIQCVGDHTFLEKNIWDQIWLHQLIRAGVLRKLFEAMPTDLPEAYLMDRHLNDIPVPPGMLITDKSYAVWGESTSHGMLTQNCHESLIKFGFHDEHWFSKPITHYAVMG